MYSCCAFVFFSPPRGPILLEELWLVQTPVAQLVVFHHWLCNEGSGGTLLLLFKCCFLLFSIQLMFVVFLFTRCLLFFNRCFPWLAPQWRLLWHILAFFYSIALIHSICSKCSPLFHLTFTNLGILPITWGFLLRQDHRGALWWGTSGIYWDILNNLEITSDCI